MASLIRGTLSVIAVASLAFAPAGVVFAATSSSTAAQVSKPSACFYVNQFENWRAPNAKTIYIRVGLNRYYRLDLAGTYPMLMWPGVHLVMDVRGPDTICSALDWDLKISDNWPGIPEGCIVRKMTALTPGEVAAIPKKFRP